MSDIKANYEENLNNAKSESVTNLNPNNTNKKILRILITAKDGNALRALLRENQLDIGGGPKQLEGGAFSIEAYIAEDQVKLLKKRGIKIDTLDDARATARARQKEVGKGNRFEGENRIPHGLGSKVSEGHVS